MTTEFDELISRAHNLLNRVKSTPTLSINSSSRNNDFDHHDLDLFMEGIPEAIDDSVVDDESLIKLITDNQVENTITVEESSFNKSNSLQDALSYCPSSSQSTAVSNIKPSYNRQFGENCNLFSFVMFVIGLNNISIPSFSFELESSKLCCNLRIFFRQQRSPRSEICLPFHGFQSQTSAMNLPVRSHLPFLLSDGGSSSILEYWLEFRDKVTHKLDVNRLLGWSSIDGNLDEKNDILTRSIYSASSFQQCGSIEFKIILEKDLKEYQEGKPTFLFDSMNENLNDEIVINETDETKSTDSVDSLNDSDAHYRPKFVLSEMLLNILLPSDSLQYDSKVFLEKPGEVEDERGDDNSYDCLSADSVTHILDVSIHGNFFPWNEKKPFPIGYMGCFVCYSLPKLEHSHQQKISRIFFANEHYTELKQHFSLWWDTEYSIFNGQNRHIFNAANNPLDVCNSLGLNPADGVLVYLVACDEDGNFPDSATPFAKGAIDLIGIETIFRKNHNDVLVRVPLTSVGDGKQICPDFLTLKVCHISEPAKFNKFAESKYNISENIEPIVVKGISEIDDITQQVAACNTANVVIEHGEPLEFTQTSIFLHIEKISNILLSLDQRSNIFLTCCLIDEKFSSTDQARVIMANNILKPITYSVNNSPLYTPAENVLCNLDFSLLLTSNAENELSFPDFLKTLGLVITFYERHSLLRTNSVEIRATDTEWGKAIIDLSPLACGMPTIEGWYHIRDSLQRCIGQIKLKVQFSKDCIATSQFFVESIEQPAENLFEVSAQNEKDTELGDFDVLHRCMEDLDRMRKQLIEHSFDTIKNNVTENLRGAVECVVHNTQQGNFIDRNFSIDDHDVFNEKFTHDFCREALQQELGAINETMLDEETQISNTVFTDPLISNILEDSDVEIESDVELYQNLSTNSSQTGESVPENINMSLINNDVRNKDTCSEMFDEDLLSVHDDTIIFEVGQLSPAPDGLHALDDMDLPDEDRLSVHDDTIIFEVGQLSPAPDGLHALDDMDLPDEDRLSVHDDTIISEVSPASDGLHHALDDMDLPDEDRLSVHDDTIISEVGQMSPASDDLHHVLDDMDLPDEDRLSVHDDTIISEVGQISPVADVKTAIESCDEMLNPSFKNVKLKSYLVPTVEAFVCGTDKLLENPCKKKNLYQDTSPVIESKKYLGSDLCEDGNIAVRLKQQLSQLQNSLQNQLTINQKVEKGGQYSFLEHETERISKSMLGIFQNCTEN